MQLLLENGADVNAFRGRYDNALRAAINWRREEVVKLLLKNGANVNAKNKKNRTVLDIAMTYPITKETIQLLLDFRAQRGHLRRNQVHLRS